MAVVSLPDWIAFVAAHPEAHFLQTPAWGELKSEFGWQANHIIAGNSGAQILFRRLPLGFTVAYIPHGPVGRDWDALWPEVDALCRQKRAVFLKVEPDIWEVPGSEYGGLLPDDFQKSAHTIQPPRTLVIDLDAEEEEILERMKQKTRYNVRLAEKKGIVVRPSADVAAFAAMMEITGERDAFGVHTQAYYQRAYELFHPIGACELFLASYDGIPLAGLMVFAHGRRAWYLYGASNNQHRNRMPTYLLQWEAIRWAKEKGCTQYDLWGVPDHAEEELEAQFAERSDGLWGVYRFKRGFGGQLKRVAGAWDKVYMPFLYQIYRLYFK
jgi:lipid II:glycine glycyltransferase (peptidoglycan interpeptide bridge formation enzyme)